MNATLERVFRFFLHILLGLKDGAKKLMIFLRNYHPFRFSENERPVERPDDRVDTSTSTDDLIQTTTTAVAPMQDTSTGIGTSIAITPVAPTTEDEHLVQVVDDYFTRPTPRIANPFGPEEKGFILV